MVDWLVDNLPRFGPFLIDVAAQYAAEILVTLTLGLFGIVARARRK